MIFMKKTSIFLLALIFSILATNLIVPVVGYAAEAPSAAASAAQQMIGGTLPSTGASLEGLEKGTQLINGVSNKAISWAKTIVLTGLIISLFWQAHNLKKSGDDPKAKMAAQKSLIAIGVGLLLVAAAGNLLGFLFSLGEGFKF
jgi:hypothetical protein